MRSTVSPLEGWEIDQFIKLKERQPGLIEQAIQCLVSENEDIRWSLVIGAYQDRQINLGKASELLDLSELELRDSFTKLGIPLRLSPADVVEARADAEAIRAWQNN